MFETAMGMIIRKYSFPFKKKHGIQHHDNHGENVVKKVKGHLIEGKVYRRCRQQANCRTQGNDPFHLALGLIEKQVEKSDKNHLFDHVRRDF